MTISQYLDSVKDKKIAVIGAGVSNMPLIELFCRHGISVSVHDRKDAEALGSQYAALIALGAVPVLGETYLAEIDADIVFRTPGLPPRMLEHVRARGSRITSEMDLFFSLCPCPIIAITGSDGKTTTTTLVSEMLRAAGYTCHLGGNIGSPLLPRVAEIDEEDIAVVELSSFQLMDMTHSPDIAAITNLSPNHLDYHADYAEYVQAKTNIFAFQQPGERLVLNADDSDSMALTLNENSTISLCSKKKAVANGTFLKDGVIYAASGGSSRALMPASAIGIPGAHNVSNVMMAAAIVQGLCTDEIIDSVARSFAGVPHRIELVAEKKGVRYYNDSIASSPTRTIAGLNAFSQKVILIAGGYDKKIPYDAAFGETVCRHVSTLILTGQTAPKIRDCTLAVADMEKPEIYEVPALADAVRKASEVAKAGDIVIMSPASASFDHFKNFEERGNVFKSLVCALD